MKKKIFINLIKSSNKNIGTKFSLIYRASRDGWKSSDFHTKCDNKGKTICIVRSDTNNVFGGFTSVSWTTDSGKFHKDSNAFLFLIRSSKNYESQIFNLKTEKKDYAVQHYWNYMCRFGDGCDIVIYMSCNTNTYSYTCQSSYDIPDKHYLNGGNRNFKVEEIEVFTTK